MHIENYIAFVYKDEVPQSVYQLIADKTKEEYGKDVSTLRLDLIDSYAGFLCNKERDLADKYAFLSYHESKYKGANQLFLEFVKWSYKDLQHKDFDFYILQALKNSIKPVAKGWLKYRESFAEEEENVKLPNDPRIWVMKNKKTPYTSDQIRFWFEGELLIENKKGDPIMDEDDFDLFIRSWFAGTGEIVKFPLDRLLNTNISGSDLMKIIKSFYLKYGKNIYNKGLRYKMTNLLPETFEKLKNSKPESIRKNL